MSVVDLHPEELLDKEGRGELDEVELERLEAHVARCAACRLERVLRADFASELAEPESRGSLAGDIPGAPASSPALQDVPRASLREAAPAAGRLRPAARTTWLLVAAALVVSMAAAGAGGRGPRWLRLVRTSFATDPSEVTAAPATSAREGTRGPTSGPVRRPDPVGDTPTTVSRESPPVAVPDREAVPAAVSPVAHAPMLPAPPTTSRGVSGLGPAAMFDAARAARLQGDYPRVMELHRELLVRYPSSREAQVSRATVGQLLLDRGDPSGALASFDAYLAAGSGELSEVVLVGRATALDRLGRGDEARGAWRALLVAVPDTPYAAHARTRVGEPRLVRSGDP